MSVFDDNPFVRVAEGEAPASLAPRADEIATGSYWSLLQKHDEFTLEYLSGSLEGRRKRLDITPEEALRLHSGDDKIAEQVIIAHGAC